MAHDDAFQSVGLFWTSNQFVAKTSTWQHTTITATSEWRDSNPQNKKAATAAQSLRTHGFLCRSSAYYFARVWYCDIHSVNYNSDAAMCFLRIIFGAVNITYFLTQLLKPLRNFFPVVLVPSTGLGLVILEFCGWHTTTHSSRKECCERVISM